MNLPYALYELRSRHVPASATTTGAVTDVLLELVEEDPESSAGHEAAHVVLMTEDGPARLAAMIRGDEGEI